MSLAQAEAFQKSLPSGRRRTSKIFRWFTALDNYTPVREHTNGHAVTFIQPDGISVGVVLIGINKLVIPAESVYVVHWPDGTTVPMVPVAWHGSDGEYGPRVVLHPYPNDLLTVFGPKRSYFIRLSDKG